MYNKAAVEAETSRFHHKEPFIYILTDQAQPKQNFTLVSLKFV